MTHTRRYVLGLGVAALTLACGISAASGPLPSLATPVEGDELGFSYALLATGTTTTVELRLAPRGNFDSVTVEKGSGVATLAPPCAFTGLIAGGRYSCRVDLTADPAHPAMTVNVIGRRQSPGAPVPETEIHHVSIGNGAFTRPAQPRTPSSHQLPASASRPER